MSFTNTNMFISHFRLAPCPRVAAFFDAAKATSLGRIRCTCLRIKSFDAFGVPALCRIRLEPKSAPHVMRRTTATTRQHINRELAAQGRGWKLYPPRWLREYCLLTRICLIWDQR